MPIINKQGELTTVTVSPEAEKRMIDFERQAIEQNMVVQQHGGAAMLEEQEKSTEKPLAVEGASLKLFKLSKKIAGQSETSISSTLELVQPHIAASTVEKSVTSKQNNNNLVLRNLMKRIANCASPFSL
jgi:hypothetical protein